MYKYYLKSFLCIIALTSLFFKNANADLLVGSPEEKLSSSPSPTPTPPYECISPDHLVSGICCPDDRNYIVNGSCSECPENERLVGGSCCSDTAANRCDNLCPFYKAKTNYSGGVSQTTVSKNNFLTSASDAPACFVSKLNLLYDACEAQWGAGSKVIDDCALDFLVADRYGSSDWYASLMFPPSAVADLKDLIDVNYNANCSLANSDCGVRSSYETASSATFYFDNSCNPVSMSGNDLAKACNAGMINVLASPISLLFGVSYEELAKQSTIVNFKLKPESGDYVDWKASSRAPLLVYDPLHSGKITSASQLFGEWTFGGKRKASLEQSVLSDKQNSSNNWENGYAALSTLDLNLDNKISTNELAPLALWFDHNQNGISEDGEVVAAQNFGIKTLYYKDAEKNLITNDLVLNLGYEREVNGKLEKGPSVDWYGVTANSNVELLQKKDIYSKLCNTQVKSTNNTNSNFASSNKKDPGFSGSWIWSSESDNKAGGLLIFSINQDGVFKGVSMFNLKLQDGKAVEAFKVLKLNGEIRNNQIGMADKLYFTHKSNDGVYIESVVQLQNKQEIKGETKAYYLNGKEKIIVSEYSWTGNRRK